MKTTAVVVELALIGFAAVFSVFSLLYPHDSPIIPILLGLSPVLLVSTVVIFSYVLGIILDRIADAVLNGLEDELRLKCASSLEDFRDMRSAVFRDSEHVKEWLVYSRQRVRVSRGWAIVSPLLAFSVFLDIVFHEHGVQEIEYLKFLYIIAGALWLAFYATWISLTLGEAKRISREYKRLSLVGRDEVLYRNSSLPPALKW